TSNHQKLQKILLKSKNFNHCILIEVFISYCSSIESVGIQDNLLIGNHQIGPHRQYNQCYYTHIFHQSWIQNGKNQQNQSNNNGQYKGKCKYPLKIIRNQGPIQDEPLPSKKSEFNNYLISLLK